MQLFVRGLQGGWSSVLSLQGSDTVADLKAAVEVSSMHFCYLAALVCVHAATVLLLLLALLADACVTQLLMPASAWYYATPCAKVTVWCIMHFSEGCVAFQLPPSLLFLHSRARSSSFCMLTPWLPAFQSCRLI
jgi:hypothetical protein